MMLVLTRRKSEVITIGDGIRITVTDIRGDSVRIGIDAPKEIPVHRLEVFEAIERERKRAEIKPDAGFDEREFPEVQF